VIRRFLVMQNADLIALELNTRRRPEPPPASPVARAAERAWAPAALDQVAEAQREAESRLILEALTSTNWNRRKAAAKLQIDYRALLYKMKRLSIGEARESATVH
jgi:two-component system response regulator AtoC